MSRFNTPTLEARHYSLFGRAPHAEFALTGASAFKQTLLVIFWMVIGAGFVSIIPNRRPPHQPMGLVAGGLFALLIGGGYLYHYIWWPWRNGPLGYQLVGEFEVREKDNLFSKYWVRLLPGDNFLVQVPAELYERLRVGSRLRLIYTAQGEQISVAQLA